MEPGGGNSGLDWVASYMESVSAPQPFPQNPQPHALFN